MVDPEMRSIAESLVKSANNNTVTVDKLLNEKTTSIGKFSNDPIISYLYEDEQPYWIYALNHPGVTISGPGIDQKLSPGIDQGTPAAMEDQNGWFVVTNMRMLLVMKGPKKDDVIGIPLSIIEYFDCSNNLIIPGAECRVRTEDYKYEISIMKRKYPDDLISYIQNEDGDNQAQLEEQHYLSTKETVIVCKECKQEVPDDAKKCPHCGYYPGGGGKGNLWHATAYATSWTPVGMAMLAKGAADEARTRKGIAEEHTKTVEESGNQESVQEDPFEKLRELKDLKDDGVISEEEFHRKKEEILEDV